MTSDKKAEANRRNSLKSTGPRTPEGKAAVRLNALKHGLLSEEVLLPGEDDAALRELTESLRAQLQPVGELETLLVDRITSLLWRLRRVEAGIFAWELYGELAERAEREARAQEPTMASMMIAAYTSVTDKRKPGEALERAEQMRVKQDAETATLGRTFVRDAENANAFSKLSRYEIALERAFTGPSTNSSASSLLAPRPASRHPWLWTLISQGSPRVIARSLALFRKNANKLRLSTLIRAENIK